MDETLLLLDFVVFCFSRKVMTKKKRNDDKTVTTK